MLTIVKVHRDGYHLDCWLSGGKHFRVEPPERPYFYDRSFHARGHEARTLAKVEKLRKYQLDVGKLEWAALKRAIWGLAPVQSESSSNNSDGDE